MKTVLGIFRAACFSPGMVERDEAVLRAVMARMEASGYAVSYLHEEELVPDTPMPYMALHMARSPQALEVLLRWQRAGCRVVNSVEGVHSVERASLARWCAVQGIPTPKTWIIDTADCRLLCTVTTEGVCEDITFPCWVKRAGTCAQESSDVCRVTDAEEYRACMSRYRSRGICEAVVMEHLEGPCVKFYAVPGANFFYSLPMGRLGYDKFAGNTSECIEDDTSWACEAVNRQAPKWTSMLDVYGGDAIVGPDGVARLMDLNDWPSFSACRAVAAEAIALMIMNKTCV